MKKVCVSTYCEYSSYGSILQTIGLKSALQELGLESFVAKDRPAPSAYLTFPLISKNPKILIKNLYRYLHRKKLDNQYSNTLAFMNKYVDICYYDNYDLMKANIPDADFYIAGSDQIWHPALCKPSFFLDFVPNEKKRISYAASMGVTEIAEAKKENFAALVEKMDTVSVREEEMVEVLEEYTDKPISVHIDPTFLKAKEEWRKHEKAYDIKKPYVLVYPIYWDVKLNKELRKLHKKTGLDIVVICSGLNKVYANKRIYDADPGQFLWLIDRAEAVVTSSFHGTAFSLIFNKKFSAVINPNAKSRISSLLKVLGAKNQGIAEVLDFDLTQYDHINTAIQAEQNRSFAYLKKELLNE